MPFISFYTNIYFTNLEIPNILRIIDKDRERSVVKVAVTQTDNMAEMQKHATEAANLLKNLSNENRLLILCTLIEGELSVGQLNELIPLSQSALSQHLSSLRNAGLVKTRRESQTIFYSLSGDEAIRVIAVLQSIYCPEI